MLAIRLQRVGKKKFPTYRLIVSEKGRDTHDNYLENLGTYNPHAKENAFQPNTERITYWMSKGAETSDTIHNLLVTAGVVKGDKKKSVFLSQKRKAKVAEKRKAQEEKAAATKKAAEEKKAQEEAEREAKKAEEAAAAAAPEEAPQA